MPFYEEIAADYDDMTGFEQRLDNADRFARRLLGAKSATTALDVATGTGIYALALARCGVRTVVGSDLSAVMLEQAEIHARDLGLAIQWVSSPMEILAERLAGQRFDLVLCLGNSVPHLIQSADLHKTLRGFRKLLNAQGRVLIQTLNYERVLAERERIVEINRNDRTEFIRFYDFRADGLLHFNILHIRWQGAECEHRLHTTVLYPYRRDELSAALDACGFRNVTTYGNVDFTPFDPATSDTCLLAAER